MYCAHCNGPFSVTAAGAEKERYRWMEEIMHDGLPGAAPAQRVVYYDGYGRFYCDGVALRMTGPVVHARCALGREALGRYRRWAQGQFFDWDAFVRRPSSHATAPRL